MSEVIRCKGSKVCSPFVSPGSNSIFYVSTGTGEIFEYNSNSEHHTSIVFSGGEPLGAQIDSNGKIHIADVAHAAILRVEDSGQPGIMVKSYEEKTFKVRLWNETPCSFKL